MRIIDVTMPVSSRMLTWPSDPDVTIIPSKSLGDDGANVSELRSGTHTGTHVDPPLHFIDGAIGVDKLPLEKLVGPAYVADLTACDRRIGPEQLDALAIPEGITRLLMRTRNSELWERPVAPAFPDDYVALTPEGARWCIERGLVMVGTDFLSIEQRGAPGHPVHVALLRAGVVIVEGLALFGVEHGEYEVAVLPLKIVDGDGAPARAILIRR